MKTVNFSIFFFLSILFLSCDSDDPEPALINYFPLQVGNYWTYGEGDFSYTNIIDKKEVINGVEYFHMTRLRGEKEYSQGHYRINLYGDVFNRIEYAEAEHYTESSAEYVEVTSFKFRVVEGSSWVRDTSKNDLYDWHVTLISKTATVKIGDQEFANCFQFLLNIPQVADEARYVFIAPGIGRIMSKSLAWGGETKLKKARINGKEYEF